MRFSFLFSFLTFAFILSHQVFAINLQSSDIKYYIHKNPDFSLIFSENFLYEQQDDIAFIHKKLKFYNDIYKENFRKKLKEIPVYVFASPRNQISNAAAGGAPLKVTFFPTGIQLITKMAITSWTDTLIAHEMAHIYQLGQVSDSIRHFISVFKNSHVIFIPFPLFLNVNSGMSSFFLEGHAVLNESLHAYGGRLYSGSTRALIFSQIKHRFKTTDHFIKNYLVNTTLKNFAVEQHYSHGGYFFSSVLEKYSFKQINNIFTRHAEHFILPLSFVSVKNAFQDSFKTSFESLAHQYIQRYQPLAKKQKKSPVKTQFKSKVCLDFNQDKRSIFFLTSDLKSAPVLRIFNKKTKKWKTKRKIFSTGKVFKLKNNFYVSASHKINPVELVYGLFAEGMHFYKYKSQSLQDLWKNHRLSIDTSNNIRGFNLLLNGKFYSKTHSTALFGPNGNIYFFKQEKDKRVLYKNKTPLFQFRGFYGKPVKTNEESTVYFIAASPYGSSLFAWTKQQGIYRISESDVIVDAIQRPDNKFLVCEIEPEFYSYKFITPTAVKEKPAFYTYSFKTASNALLLQSIENSQLASEETYENKAKPAEQFSLDETFEENYFPEEEKPSFAPPSAVDGPPAAPTAPASTPRRQPQSTSSISHTAYHPLKYIKFQGINAGINNDPITQYKIFTGIVFADSMKYNRLKLNYEFFFDNWAIQGQYINQKHRLNWNIEYTYKQGLQNFSGKRAYSYNHRFGLGFSYPVFLKGYLSSSIGLKSIISSHQIRKMDQYLYYFGFQPFFQLNYKRSYRHNHGWHRRLIVHTAFDSKTNLSSFSPHYEWKNIFQYSMHLGQEFYSTFFINHQTALKSNSIPFRHFKPLNLFETPKLDIYLRENLIEQTNDLLQAGARIKKFIETPLYFSRYPVSIESFAPIMQFKYINYLDNNKKNERVSFFEWAGGMDINFLFHHKIKYTLNFYYGLSHKPTWNKTKPKPASQPIFGLTLKTKSF